MEKALKIQQEVINILGTDEVYLVGGSVRDLVMDNEPKDYDFCTPMLPDEMEERIKAAGRRPYGIGKKFGTMGFKVQLVELKEISDMGPNGLVMDGKPLHSFEVGVKTEYEYVEVTTFRSEVYTSKSRKPDVKFVPNLEEDLARRDFTMNAMVLSPNGKIYDPYGGKLDIHAKRIRTVGMPKDRINEDPLRILRAARFAARYGFEIDPNFIGKARQLADRIYDVSVERWVQEIDKLLTSKYRNNGIIDLQRMGMLIRILPEVYAVLKMYPDFEGIEFFNKDGEYTPDLAWTHFLGWTGLPHMDLPDDSRNKLTDYINAGICQRLKFSNGRTNAIIKGK